MCDFSLHHLKSRPAKVGDKLTTRDFGTGTLGFAASEKSALRFACCQGRSCPLLDEVRCESSGRGVKKRSRPQDRDLPAGQPRRSERHHDALEFPDGQIVLLTSLTQSQHATVLQLPAAAVGAKVPQRVAYV